MLLPCHVTPAAFYVPRLYVGISANNTDIRDIDFHGIYFRGSQGRACFGARLFSASVQWFEKQAADGKAT